MANITTNFSSLNSIDSARQQVANSGFGLIDALNWGYIAFSNGYLYAFSSYDVRSSTKVAGYLTNGDYAIADGNTMFPTNITHGYYSFTGLDITCDFYGSASEAYQYARPTGYLNKLVMDGKNNTITISGYDDLTTAPTTFSNFEVKNSQVSFSGNGNLSSIMSKDTNGSWLGSVLTGNLNSLSLSSGSNSISVSGINVDVASLSKYATFASFLESVMSGNDVVTGTNFSEYLMGYTGNDYLNAGFGDDTLDGGAGNDILDGGLGSNTAVYHDYKSNYNISKSGAMYSISSSIDGTDTLSNIAYLQFYDGTVAIDSALPLIAPPKVIQNVASQTTAIKNQNITGTSGNDTLSGSNGNDTLVGSLGADTLTGSLSADVFKFNNLKDSGITEKTRDIITDFKTSEGDKIDLSAIDANTVKSGDQSFAQLDIGTPFSGKFTKTNRLFFDTTSHILYGNTDTKSDIDFSIQLNGVNSITLKDFIL